MSSTDVLLARHGAFNGIDDGLAGRRPLSLNAEGWQQAGELAIVCAALGATRVLSGPQVRAVETAAEIARECRTSVELTPEVDEIDYGEWTGRSFARLADDPRWKRFNEARDESEIPGGEHLSAVRRRITISLETLALTGRGECTVVVTHAEIIRGALLVARAEPWSSWSTYEIPPGTLTWLQCSPRVTTVRAIGALPALLWPSNRGAYPIGGHARAIPGQART